jgi:pyruvate/2-oxoglutarate dehydrogenase complex dihydrolipoamide acyltransferase (E2) component
MDIVPFYGQEPLSVQHVAVRVNPADQERADALVLRTSAIVKVEDNKSFNEAKSSAGQLKAILNEIEIGKKAARQPFGAITEAINEQARLVGNPVENEHKRILGLLNSYVAQVEARQKAEERQRAEAIRLQQEEHDRKIKEAQEAQAKAEAQARAATDELARVKARADANAQLLVAAQEQLAKEMAMEVAAIGSDKPRRGLVPGGRVDHPYEFKLKNLRETINAGCINLLRWELDMRACQDSVRAQLEIDPNCTPSLPGIEITRKINVSVKASARIL